jgi:ATP-dependent Lon protease
MSFGDNRDQENKDKMEELTILPMLPLRDIIIFPHMVVPLFVGRERSINALDEAMNKDKRLFLAAQKDAKIQDPDEKDVYRVGTIGSVIQMLRLPDGTVKVLVEGQRRAVLTDYLSKKEIFLVRVRPLEEIDGEKTEVEALIRSIQDAFEHFARLNRKIPQDMIQSISSIEEPGKLADTIVGHLNLKLPDKQDLLETRDKKERLEKLYALLKSEIEILEVERKIRSRVRKQMEKTQKEYYLNEQMRAIQKELGEKDEFKNEIDELEARLRKKKMSKEGSERVKKEIKKLRMMSPMSAEATVVRNYIDWILSLPWYEYTQDEMDIDKAETILNEDHYGLEKVKERILEYLAVRSLVEKMKAPILCFVGPPGVGKTSLGKSIARATGRKFVRASLGGVRDEAEIRGHRRTYIGALPGKIIQYMKKAGSGNPVFLLDEVDKMSTDFRGDPAAALLEVLDPEQNHAFNDHYLDLDYDLSRVMFITTANTLYNIPRPLQDRMEIIRIEGYIETEKLQIANGFLIPKQFEAHGLSAQTVGFTENSILTIIRRYTREAGVRNLEREIASVCRKMAREIVKKGRETKIRVTTNMLSKYLGVPKYRFGVKEAENRIGLTNGLAWTENGGELLTTEVTVMPGKGKLIITGKLGDVMQESVQAAMSYVRSRADMLNLEKDFYHKVDIHVHIPEGAIPKDGPSAGITVATSIASALTRRPARSDIAMTGEITLRGRVLPIGGLKEKALAAHRADIDTVLIPAENEKDIREVPPQVLKKVKLVLVEHMDEVLNRTLLPDPVPEPIAKRRKGPDEEEPEGLEKGYVEESGTTLV